jgi:adenylate cyclase
VRAAPGVSGGDYVDILPAIPSFAGASRGAGFTNVVIDTDGVRRRIFLAQEVQDHWYLQLAFAPLVDYLGNPEIYLEKRRVTLKNARVPGGEVRDIVIPLDTGGRMMLDWPKTDYQNSYTHISFVEFSRLEQLEAQMEQYLTELENTGLSLFTRFDETLLPVSGILYRINPLFAAAREERSRALAECSDEAFDRYLGYRAEALGLIRSITALGLGAKTRAAAEALEQAYPEDAEAIHDEAEYIATLAEYLGTAREHYEAAQARFRDALGEKFCVIGRVDTGTTDIGVNPFYSKYVNVGTHAVALDTILRESFIKPLSPLWSAVLCLILTILPMLALGALKPVPRSALGVGAALVFGTGFFLLFRQTGVFIGPLGPVLSVLIAVIVRELASYVASEKEKQFIDKAFSTYVSREVVDELVANPALLQLGGSKRQMSAIFSDLQGFSTISEQLDPEQLVQLLNRYLTVMSDIIMENKGTIDKYEGDAVIAFFGAPVSRADHAILACRSALDMKRAEEELNLTIMAEGLSPTPLYTRIGVNSGEMVVGNMGTSNKMNYTIMGNAVNLAARLEGINKQYNTGGILISEYTKNEIGDEFICRSLDRVRVVGINTPLRLYELLGLRNDANISLSDGLATWESALALYEQRDFSAAADIFSGIAAGNEQDGVARLYRDRCLEYVAEPPPGDWDGVNNLTSK